MGRRTAARASEAIENGGTGTFQTPSKTAFTDAELTDHIRETIRQTPFFGEGHRKIWARLRHAGIRTSKARCSAIDAGSGVTRAGTPASRGQRQSARRDHHY